MSEVDPVEPADPDGSTRWSKPWVLSAVAAAALVAGVAIGFLIWSGDDDDGVGVAVTTTTEVAVTTTTSAATTTDPTTTSTPPDETATAVWPWYESAQRFSDPVAAARSFAVDFVGFSDVVLGEFRQGDARSGEVGIRATEGGPETTVFVRQLGVDDEWWVTGSATANIEIDSPAALGEIDSPVRLEGRARAFEGTVVVQIRADGEQAPVGEGFVTGRGDGVLGDFSSDLVFTNPGSGWGTVVFSTFSARDGSVMEVGAVRVRFGAG